MAIIVDRIKVRKITAGQDGFNLVVGAAHFDGTDLEGEVPCLLNSVEAFHLGIIGAPSAGDVGQNSLLGAVAAAAAGSISRQIEMGSVSATSKFIVIAPAAGTVSALSFTEAAGITANDTNYWTFGVINKSNSDAVLVDNTDAANSTKETGGSSLVAYEPFALTKTATPADLAVDAGDVLEVTITKASSATTMTEAVLTLAVTTSTATATQKWTILATSAGTLDAASIVNASGISASDTNYWSIGIINKSNSDAVMVDITAAANTTKTTGGNALVAYTPQELTLSSTGADLAVDAGDVLEITLTATGSPTALAEANVSLTIATTGMESDVYLDEDFSVAQGILMRPSTGGLTVKRGGDAPVEDLAFTFMYLGI